MAVAETDNRLRETSLRADPSRTDTSRADSLRLSSPQIFLVRIVVFLILIGFIALILYQKIGKAFMANPGLNGLIFGVLFIGIVFGIRNVVRLFREIALGQRPAARRPPPRVKPPILLAPMATLLGDQPPTSGHVHRDACGSSSIPSAPGSTRRAKCRATSPAC